MLLIHLQKINISIPKDRSRKLYEQLDHLTLKQPEKTSNRHSIFLSVWIITKVDVKRMKYAIFSKGFYLNSTGLFKRMKYIINKYQLY